MTKVKQMFDFDSESINSEQFIDKSFSNNLKNDGEYVTVPLELNLDQDGGNAEELISTEELETKLKNIFTGIEPDISNQTGGNPEVDSDVVLELIGGHDDEYDVYNTKVNNNKEAKILNISDNDDIDDLTSETLNMLNTDFSNTSSYKVN